MKKRPFYAQWTSVLHLHSTQTTSAVPGPKSAPGGQGEGRKDSHPIKDWAWGQRSGESHHPQPSNTPFLLLGFSLICKMGGRGHGEGYTSLSLSSFLFQTISPNIIHTPLISVLCHHPGASPLLGISCSQPLPLLPRIPTLPQDSRICPFPQDGPPIQPSPASLPAAPAQDNG